MENTLDKKIEEALAKLTPEERQVYDYINTFMAEHKMDEKLALVVALEEGKKAITERTQLKEQIAEIKKFLTFVEDDRNKCVEQLAAANAKLADGVVIEYITQGTNNVKTNAKIGTDWYVADAIFKQVCNDRDAANEQLRNAREIIDHSRGSKNTIRFPKTVLIQVAAAIGFDEELNFPRIETQLDDICKLWSEIRPTLCDGCDAPDLERMDKLTRYKEEEIQETKGETEEEDMDPAFRDRLAKSIKSGKTITRDDLLKRLTSSKKEKVE